MPKIDFSAPVIRLGASTGSKPSPITPGLGSRKDSSGEPMSAGPGRTGLGGGHGAEQQRQAMRESMMVLVPPTKDEVLRTVFVGGITEGAGGDDGIERILQTAGNLRRWNRAIDADGKECRFGFAEYDDMESLGLAVEVLKDVHVPKHRRDAAKVKEEESEAEVEMCKLIIVVDENSLDYLEHYQSSRGDEESAGAQARLDKARSRLSAVLAELKNPTVKASPTEADRDGDISMRDSDKAERGVEIVNIPLTVDDELSDIPAEMRETVAKEIAAFRDRSNRRDMERLKREEEIELQERTRGQVQARSPPPQAPTGPNKSLGANGIPLGPRDRGTQGVPSGPKGFQGQIPRDYQKGVKFVNGSGINGDGGGWINRDDEDSDASDEELERRRRDKKAAELEKLYLDQERRWLNRERSRTAAVDREKKRDVEDELAKEREKEAVAKRLSAWDDGLETGRKAEEYYADRSLWLRNRATFRQREQEQDERDRAAEDRDRARDEDQRAQARGMADQFLERAADELAAAPQHRDELVSGSREPQRFKLSLGAAAQKAQAPRRTMAEVEGLLEDEEEGDTTTKRTLVPITFDASADAAQALTPAERDEAVRQLAADIPTDAAGLWAWPVRWEFVDNAVITEKLKPFVEKKIVEYLGVQEQMLVEVVEEHVRQRAKPDELVGLLEGAMEDEAEALVKKLWRMIIFFSESEKRGLSG
ncbi:MAG: hypothetical protein M1832_002129 [Thelocarpon impressellum]|nr:MAG: hypothetical protein M1832_002129 [Thelocarpon impressellum]